MVIFLFLFFKMFFLSFQTIPTGFFCDDYLREVYVIENGISREIVKGWEGRWDIPYPFQNLSVDPGDLIRFTCYSGTGGAYGSGCFLIYDECFCYDFDIDKPRKNSPLSRTVKLDDIDCMMDVYPLEETDVEAVYVYEHYVPLNASELRCLNNNSIDDPLFVLNGNDLYIELSNYIFSNYSIKNVESSITTYYSYFKLYNRTLDKNDTFNILDYITFNSKIPKKYYINFRNYGKVINDTKDCGFYIRVCHKSCSECLDLDIDNDNYQCKKCKEGYFFIENTTKCVSKQEMNETNYYFDNNENIFKK